MHEQAAIGLPPEFGTGSYSVLRNPSGRGTYMQLPEVYNKVRLFPVGNGVCLSCRSRLSREFMADCVLVRYLFFFSLLAALDRITQNVKQFVQDTWCQWGNVAGEIAIKK